MRRTKKLAAVSMSAVLALASMAGCTKKDAADETTQAPVVTEPDTTVAVVDTTAAPTEAPVETSARVGEEDKDPTSEVSAETEKAVPATEEVKTTEAPTEKATEKATEEVEPKPTEEPTTAANNNTSLNIKTTDALAKLIDSTFSDAKKMSSKAEVSVDLGNMLASTASLTGVKVDFDIDSFIDLTKKQISGTVGVDLNAKELKVAGDLLRFAADNDHVAVNFDVLKLASGVFGSEDAISQLLQGMGVPVTTADIKKMTSVNLPIGTDVVNIKELDGDALDFAKDYAKRILSSVAESSVSVSGNKYTIKPDGDFVASVAYSFIQNTQDSDIDKLFEILPKVMPELNEEKLNAGLKAIASEIEKGAKAAGVDTSKMDLDGIDEAAKEITEKYNEMLAELGNEESLKEAKDELKEMLKNGKAELAEGNFGESYQKAINQINEGLTSVFKNGIPAIEVEATADGVKLAFDAEIEIPKDPTLAPNGAVVKFSVKAVNEYNKGQFQNVTDASELSDVVESVLKLVNTLQKPSASGNLNGLENILGK